VSPTRLPRLVLVSVLAFAPFEARPMLAAAELFRGMAIQLSYRWGAGRLMADDANRAVLVWSDCRPRRGRAAAVECLSAGAAVLTGLVLFIISNVLLLLVVNAALRACGVPPDGVADVRLTIVLVRLVVTLRRAVYAYQHEAHLAARLPAQTGPRWVLDLLAAAPAGSGHGRDLLQRFLERADSADTEVALHCDLRNVAFYRHHGFRVITSGERDDQLLMLRASATARKELARDLQRQRLQGFLRKAGPMQPRRISMSSENQNSPPPAVPSRKPKGDCRLVA
jgi:GNAT superfamily N-acetyltransferase